MMDEVKYINQPKYRWIAGIAGLLAIIIGFWMWRKPVNAVIAMTWIFGIIMLITGIGSIVVWNDVKRVAQHSAGLLINGILNIIIAAIMMFSHTSSILMLAVLFAVWFIVDSCTWFSFADLSGHPTLSKVFSIIGIILGVLLLFSPMLSLSTLVMFVSVTLIVYGFVVIVKVI
ncbi:HdeD family acid-resistance protein [Lactiplantibacillus plantarum]|uniref:HdeD family acid-resistance protein n=2 Tax=Lactiplantibacillus plantarum TaxID=1590 RepID=UPI001BA93976|nr:DUF308 domain-containing protein [Lactiplantibacillus plantarum]MBS0953544.1 DUF308 domain-containing protein [Lactiplantibacillus plantarum]